MVAPTSMVSFRSAKRTKNYFVKAKLYPLGQNVCSRKCNKTRCKVCNNIESADLFSTTITGQTYRINNYFNFDSKYLAYFSYMP